MVLLLGNIRVQTAFSPSNYRFEEKDLLRFLKRLLKNPSAFPFPREENLGSEGELKGFSKA
jgi:hypothetical protein